MEPWQAYDASTPELLSELSRIRSVDVREVSRCGLMLLLLVKTEASNMTDGFHCASITIAAQLESSAAIVW